MATKLTLRAEIHYKDLLESSKEEEIIEITSYVEHESDTLTWRFEQLVRLLLAEGYSSDLIQKYINYYEGEVYEIEESYTKYDVKED